jgi:hypothetical protein
MSEEQFVEERVSYALQVDDRFVIVENVPARISIQTGERFFSPETVQRLQQIVWQQRPPVRLIQTPVFQFPEPVA